MFPQKHCPFNVLKTKEKPWQIEHPLLDANGMGPFVKVLVPLSTTVKELMQVRFFLMKGRRCTDL